MKLFEIEKGIEEAYQKMLEAITPDTGEVDAQSYMEATEALEQLQMEKDKKVENVAKWIKNLKAESTAVKEQKMLFAKRQQALDNKISSLENFLAYAVGEGQEFKSDDCAVTIKWRKSKQLEYVGDISELDERFIRYKEPEVNKAELKKAVESGEEIKGASIVVVNNIQIK